MTPGKGRGPGRGSIIITLLTDFGGGDAYVAAMKGVILGIAPQATIVDVTHEVPARDIQAGAFILSTVYPYFPPDTIHVAVVDPGVGTSRRALLVDTPPGRFLAPDNGLLTYVLADLAGEARAYALENTRLFLTNVSHTFHGRDVFAPVAARLVAGLPATEVGPTVSDVYTFPVPAPQRRAQGSVAGTVLHVDTFGNLITNVREKDFPAGDVRVLVAGRTVPGLSFSYQSGGELLAIIGSSGRLEIAARNGSAAVLLGVTRGAEVILEAT